MNVKSVLGEFMVVSVYCAYGEVLELYLEWMEKIFRRANSKPLLLGTDANAVSPLWYSKIKRGGRETEESGRVMDDFISANNLQVLNESSEYFTVQ